MERLLADASKLSGVEYNIDNLSDVYEAIHVIQTEMGITGTTAEEATETISGSVASVKSAWTNLLTGLADGNADVGQLLLNVGESLMTAGNNIIPAIMTALQGINEAMGEFIDEMLPELVDIVIEYLPEIIELGSEIILKLVVGLMEALPDLIAALPEIISSIVTAFKSAWPQIKEAGKDIIRGLWEGISSMGDWLWNKLKSYISSLVSRVKKSLGIASPSKVFAEIGEYMAQGLGQGWDNSIEGVNANIAKTLDYTYEGQETDKKSNKTNSSGITIVQNIQSVPQTPAQLACATRQYFEQARWAF